LIGTGVPSTIKTKLAFLRHAWHFRRLLLPAPWKIPFLLS
jgi:hypothetical protein